MTRLKSRTQACVNGFWFRQAQTGWEKQTWDFEQLCQEVAAHRAANPRHNLTTDLNLVRNEVDEYNAHRMLSIRGAEIYVTDNGVAPPFPQAPPRQRAWPSVVGGAKHVVAGVGVLVDWLGSGAMPVTSEIATQRAAVCSVCPNNQPGDLLAIFTQPVAEKLRLQLEMRHDLNLSTAYDDRLKVCDACHCPLKLKVHVPIQHIEDHLAGEVEGKLHPACWILKEVHALHH